MLSQLAEFAIKFAFVYIALGFVCSILLELLEIILMRRSRYLRAKLDQMLGRNLAKRLYAHPLISSLATGSKRQPSYIPSELFAKVLLQTIKSDPVPDDLRTSLSTLFGDGASNDFSGADFGRSELKSLQVWFDNAMDGLSSAYRRRSLLMAAAIGFIAACSLNIDLIQVSSSISQQSGREQIIQIFAKEIAKTPKTGTTVYKDQGQILDEAGRGIDYFSNLSTLPMGWRDAPTSGFFLAHMLGWVLTALAVCLTAPLAFDTLNKVSVIRDSIRPSESVAMEFSKE